MCFPPRGVQLTKEDVDRFAYEISALRVNVKTIHKLLAAGDLPHLRLGRVIRIDRRMLLSRGKAA